MEHNIFSKKKLKLGGKNLQIEIFGCAGFKGMKS